MTNAVSVPSRRSLYRRSKRKLLHLLAPRWRGHRRMLGAVVREYLAPLSRSELGLLVDHRHVALAAIAAILVYHPAVGSPPIELSAIAAGRGGFVIVGTDSYDSVGISVSCAGDVNGDGLDDLVVGAPGGDPGGDFNAGESYVIFGRENTTPVDLAAVAAGTGGFVINGIDPSDLSGNSVAGAGDVNGDGLDDIVVGGDRADPGGDSSAGESYVVFGKAETAPVNLSAVAAGDGGGFVINGIDPADRSGSSVGGAGDVNGDGLADIIVGAFGADPSGDFSAGESYVVFGKAGTASVDLAAVAAGAGEGFVINGIDGNDYSGRSVAGAGDVNGDGLADLVVGAPYADPSGVVSAGESYVIFGKASAAAVDLAAVAAGAGGFVINGSDAVGQSGRSVSGAGDVNGDGLADLVVGAPQASGSKSIAAGESYVIFGKLGTAPVSLSAVTAGAGGFAIGGIETGDGSGFSVAGAGDINGDGLADLVVGAPNADPSDLVSAGESYVIFGKANTTAVDLEVVAAGDGGFVINGINAYDSSGRSVSRAGDVNGDGIDDVIVGAPASPRSESVAGESYVVFGPNPVPPCPADFDATGDIGFGDLTALLLHWGPCPPACPWDIDDSGNVGFGDLTQLLIGWGPCPS